MNGNIFKTAAVLLGSAVVGRMVGITVAKAYPKQMQAISGRYNAAIRVSYFRRLQDKGLFDDSLLGQQLKDLYRELGNTDPEHVYVSAVVPFDGKTDVTIIQGVQAQDGQMTVYVNDRELFHGTHSQHNVVTICTNLERELGEIILRMSSMPQQG